MEQSSTSLTDSQVVAVARGDRWEVYRRLQALEIPCCCNSKGGLEAQLNSPLTAVQLWCVLWQMTASRDELVALLNRCWGRKF